MQTFQNFIAGEWVAPSTGEHFENRNPADARDVIGCFPKSGRADVERAVASARRGFEQWRRTPRRRAATCCGASATCCPRGRRRSPTS
jgi:aldehyde dehydrogenase (NAD+)